MKEYRVKYELKGTGCLTFVANNAEEAEEEFYRIMCGDKPQIEDNEWISRRASIMWKWCSLLFCLIELCTIKLCLLLFCSTKLYAI